MNRRAANIGHSIVCSNPSFEACGFRWTSSLEIVILSAAKNLSTTRDSSVAEPSSE
jgi:hypothetical protein